MRIFVDLSLSKEHRGTPHGISRVEVAIAKEMRILSNKTIPIWQTNGSKLVIGDNDIFEYISDGSHSQEPAFKNFEKTPQKILVSESDMRTFASQDYMSRLKNIEIRNRILVLIIYSISLFPGKLSQLLWQKGKLTYIKLRYLRSVWSSIRNQFKKSKTLMTRTIDKEYFVPSDIVLICGNDWSRRIYEKILNSHSANPKLAFLIYDLIPYEHPNYAVDIDTANKFTYWIGDIAQRSSFLFFISKFSQERFNVMLKDRCIESNAKQFVISLPPGLLPSSEESEPNFANNLAKTFVLVVSTIEARKNHQILISALRLAISRNEEFPQLVFVGSPGWGTESLLRDILADENLNQRVIIKSGVTDSELRWLYSKCAAVAYPSIIEGFGLPVYEAYVFKKPVVTSDCKVFSEISHPHRAMVNPYDTEAWKNAIQSAVAQNTNVDAWIDLEIPTWNKTVRDMIMFMEKTDLKLD